MPDKDTTMLGWVAVALGSWLWGSFLNQCVDRLGHLTPRPPLPAGEGESAERNSTDPASVRDSRATLERPQLTILRPARSVCLTCGERIAWHDNLPILSYLLLRGRCRHCGASIGRRTPIVETATPLIGLSLFALWGWSLAFVGAALAASWTLVAVPMRLEGRAWGVGWTWLGVVLWTIFFWCATLGGFTAH